MNLNCLLFFWLYFHFLDDMKKEMVSIIKDFQKRFQFFSNTFDNPPISVIIIKISVKINIEVKSTNRPS